MALAALLIAFDLVTLLALLVVLTVFSLLLAVRHYRFVVNGLEARLRQGASGANAANAACPRCGLPLALRVSAPDAPPSQPPGGGFA